MAMNKILLVPSPDWFTADPSLVSNLSQLQTALTAALGTLYTVEAKTDGLYTKAEASSSPTLVVEVALVGTAEVAAFIGTGAIGTNSYGVRVALDIANAEASAAEIAAQLKHSLTARDYTFVSTRSEENNKENNNDACVFGFLEAVKEGLSKDGGLFMPRDIPAFTKAELAFLCCPPTNANCAKDRYHRTAQFVLEKLLGIPQTYAAEQPSSSSASSPSFPRRYGALPVPSPAVIASCIAKAYDTSRWNGLESSVSPLTPLLLSCCEEKKEKVVDGDNKNKDKEGCGADPHPDFPNLTTPSSAAAVNVLEQYHGPTAAFKDFALQLFPAFFAVATAADPARYMILAATSGDTGVAAINGFMQNGAHDTKVMVLFPEEGVSPVQKAQMLSYSDGRRVQVVGLGADFDYCQATVKRIFNDKAVAAKLLHEGGGEEGEGNSKSTVLSSANSINWGRLLPQIVYYVHAYVDLVTGGQLAHPLTNTNTNSNTISSSSSSSLPAEFDVVVPSGNFGNILSCYVAKLMGVPVRNFVVASNENDVLADFINTGVYDITKRTLATTSSPSIDILRASNVERFLYFIHDGDTAAVRRLMAALDAEKRFALSEEVFERRVRGTFWAGRCGEERCRGVVKALFEASGGRRLLDPHTGVGAAVVEDYMANVKKGGGGQSGSIVPIVLASTAHWGKFPEPVMASLGIDKAAAVATATSTNSDAAEIVKAMHGAITAFAPNAQPVPSSLREAVAAPHKAPPMVMREPSYDGIVTAMLAFASAPVA